MYFIENYVFQILDNPFNSPHIRWPFPLKHSQPSELVGRYLKEHQHQSGSEPLSELQDTQGTLATVYRLFSERVCFRRTF